LLEGARRGWGCEDGRDLVKTRKMRMGMGMGMGM
jgi:hypothetical protein